jgi:hypothetical protein
MPGNSDDERERKTEIIPSRQPLWHKHHCCSNRFRVHCTFQRIGCIGTVEIAFKLETFGNNDAGYENLDNWYRILISLIQN